MLAGAFDAPHERGAFRSHRQVERVDFEQRGDGASSRRRTGIRQEYDRRFQTLGAMHGHDAYLIPTMLHVALHLAVGLTQIGEKAGERWRLGIVIAEREVQKLIEIVEKFLRKKKTVCYGGTAINNILPTEDQFYDKNIEIPDYDFFSPNAMEDAVELANIYAKAGYKEIEAKSGVHKGTYKVTW